MKRFNSDTSAGRVRAGQFQKPPGFLLSLRTIYWLETKLEWRNRGRIVAVAAFAVVLSVIYHYSMDPAFARSAHNLAGATLATLFFAGILLTGWNSDASDHQAFRILSLSPLDASALYVGRVFARWTVLTILLIAYLPANYILLAGTLPPARTFSSQSILLTGTALSLSSLGSLFNSMLTNRSRGVLLPVLLLPASVPVLVVAAGLLETFSNSPEANPLLALSLLAPGILYCALGSILFPFLNDEGPFSV